MSLFAISNHVAISTQTAKYYISFSSFHDTFEVICPVSGAKSIFGFTLVVVW